MIVIGFSKKHNISHVTTFERAQNYTCKMTVCKRPIRLQEFLMRYNNKICQELHFMKIFKMSREFSLKCSKSFEIMQNMIIQGCLDDPVFGTAI